MTQTWQRFYSSESGFVWFLAMLTCVVALWFWFICVLWSPIVDVNFLFYFENSWVTSSVGLVCPGYPHVFLISPWASWLSACVNAYSCVTVFPASCYDLCFFSFIAHLFTHFELLHFFISCYGQWFLLNNILSFVFPSSWPSAFRSYLNLSSQLCFFSAGRMHCRPTMTET